jgi:hypothetical protein
VKKAELREQYTRYRNRYAAGEFYTNEYALHLDEMLAEYLGQPPVAVLDDDPDIPADPGAHPS